MAIEFAALVAIDWADQKHAWALQAGTTKIETGAIDHTPEAIRVWAAELRMRFGGQSVAVALEQSRGSLVFMLTKYEHLVIFPVHPTVLVNYRKSFRPSGAKDDPSDARLLLDILTLQRDKLRRYNPDTSETRTLQFLVEERRKFVHERTRCSNRLTAHLKMYFPQVLYWFDEVGSHIVGEFLERWPSLERLHAPGRRPSSGSSSISTVAIPAASRNGWSKFGKHFRQLRMQQWSPRVPRDPRMGGSPEASSGSDRRVRRADRRAGSSASRLHPPEIVSWRRLSNGPEADRCNGKPAGAL